MRVPVLLTAAALAVAVAGGVAAATDLDRRLL